MSPPPKKRPNAAWPSGLARRESPQVHAGAERAVAGARQHDGADVGIRLGLVQGFAQRAHQRTVERVARLGTIQPEDKDSAALLADQDSFFVSHAPYLTVWTLAAALPADSCHFVVVIRPPAALFATRTRHEN
jgi:hypothetical protein